METYIALLRGVNVGGLRKVSMPLLKAAFEEAGFGAVRTYINSGNVIFSAPITEAAALQETCRGLLEKHFGFVVPVAVVRAEDWQEAMAHAPAWWGHDPAAKHNAIVVIAPATAEAIIEAIGETKPEYEQAAAYGRVIFWSAPVATFAHARWAQVVSSSEAYNSITIRNANTAKKLLALAFPQE